MLFIDSWGWITLASAREPEFEQVRACYEGVIQRGGHPVTTDYILGESITFLFTRLGSTIGATYFQKLFQAIAGGHIRLERIDAARFEKAWQARMKYKERPRISFVDFTSFVVMKELGIRQVLTNDHHFVQVNLGFELVQ